MGSNSWQQPTTDEPTLGEPHEHYATLVSGANPNSTAMTTVDCSGQVPVGTTFIQGWLSAYGAADETLSIYDTAGANTYDRVRTQVNNQYNHAHFWAPVNTDRELLYAVSSTDITSVYIRMTGYNL